MGLAATGSKNLAREVAKATGQELGAVGVNWILGPVLDVLSSARSQPLGVRTAGDDPQEVSSYGVEFLTGYHEAGLAACGKHFPSYGSLAFMGGQTEVPISADSLERLSQTALVPFRTAISRGLDAVMVGSVAVELDHANVMHACLSEQIVQNLLRTEMAFNGVVVSDCLEMEALSHSIGVGGGTVMAIKAGCDVTILCKSFTAQQEAISRLRSGVANGTIKRSMVQQSCRRVLDMKSRCTSWEQALNPAGINYLSQLQPLHSDLSRAAYDGSITIVRDEKNLLPLSQLLTPEQEFLLLTPLVNPLPASAAYRLLSEIPDSTTPEQISASDTGASIMSGEHVFQEFGRALSRQRGGRVLHTSYTANGLRPMHEDLINRAGAIVVVTADAGRNLYQYGFTKHASMICRMSSMNGGERKEKPFIVVSVSSPYDFVFDQSIETYVCTYDFTQTALQALLRVLYGEMRPTGVLPGTIGCGLNLQQSRQHWLVENWDVKRDSHPLEALLKSIRGPHSSQESILSGVAPNTFLLRNADIEEAHLVVRNSSTKELYGFCSTYYFKSTAVGVIGSIIVGPNRRRLSIGHSLHNRAMLILAQKRGIKMCQLGSRLPSIFLGIPTVDAGERKRLKQWFGNMGWKITKSQMLCNMILRNLPVWSPPEDLSQTLSNPDYKFDLVYGTDYSKPVLEHVKRKPITGVHEVYKLALADKASCGIIRAKRPDDGFILGTLVLYKSDAKLAGFVPALADTKVLAGGISSPVISPLVGDPAALIQGLILLGIRQIKKQGANAVVLDCVGVEPFVRATLTDRGRLRMAKAPRV